ncbi:Cobalt-precorrin-5B C(1)-methyltransferase [Bienertia sinuspersici]
MNMRILVRIGNWRWGDNGYVQGGRQEARAAHRMNPQTPGGSSAIQPVASRMMKN